MSDIKQGNKKTSLNTLKEIEDKIRALLAIPTAYQFFINNKDVKENDYATFVELGKSFIYSDNKTSKIVTREIQLYIYTKDKYKDFEGMLVSDFMITNSTKFYDEELSTWNHEISLNVDSIIT